MKLRPREYLYSGMIFQEKQIQLSFQFYLAQANFYHFMKCYCLKLYERAQEFSAIDVPTNRKLTSINSHCFN